MRIWFVEELHGDGSLWLDFLLQSRPCIWFWGFVVVSLSLRSWHWLGSTTKRRWSAASEFPFWLCFERNLMVLSLDVFWDEMFTFQWLCMRLFWSESVITYVELQFRNHVFYFGIHHWLWHLSVLGPIDSDIKCLSFIRDASSCNILWVTHKSLCTNRCYARLHPRAVNCRKKKCGHSNQVSYIECCLVSSFYPHSILIFCGCCASP